MRHMTQPDKKKPLGLILATILFSFATLAQDERNPRHIRHGVELSDTEKTALHSQISSILNTVQEFHQAQESTRFNSWIQDIEVVIAGVQRVIKNQEFKDKKEIAVAQELLQMAQSQMSDLKNGEISWQWGNTSGFAVRGYQSALDGSLQPYGLEIPKSARQTPQKAFPLEVWLHGRDDGLHEVKFMKQRLERSSPFPSHDALVLHPYGRFCNAFKFAGEIDVLEAIEAVKKDYNIDDSAIILRGFSMGGGGVWHIASHYADKFAFASPGAGFSESFDYLGLARKPERPTYEQTLWNWYDATRYALNFFNLPVSAYSGEKDKQIQAANMMASAMAREGIHLHHVIGKNMGHKYDPQSLAALESSTQGNIKHRQIAAPHQIEFVTYTLKYPGMHWFTATRLGRHWQEARASIQASPPKSTINLTLKNIEEFSITFKAGEWSGPMNRSVTVIIDGQKLSTGIHPKSDRSLNLLFSSQGKSWKAGTTTTPQETRLVKKPGLQGPIDDAFLSSFIAVPPSENGWHDSFDKAARMEFQTLTREWNRQMRGTVRIKPAATITEGDIQSANLILFGDPQSNPLIKKVISSLPLQWNSENIQFQNLTFPAHSSMPKLIFPNPLNPEKYVVLNSGFTFHSTQLTSNADQTPKLPDFAIVNIPMTTNSQTTSDTQKILHAGFFSEFWDLEDR